MKMFYGFSLALKASSRQSAIRFWFGHLGENLSKSQI